MHLGPRGAVEPQTHPSLNAIAIVPSGWMVAWSTRARQASGVYLIAGFSLRYWWNAVMAARLASSSCSCFSEGLDFVEVVLVVGFEPGVRIVVLLGRWTLARRPRPTATVPFLNGYLANISHTYPRSQNVKHHSSLPSSALKGLV